MGTAVRPAKTSPGRRDAFADVDVFVDEVLAELEAMAKNGDRPLRSGPKPAGRSGAAQGRDGDLVVVFVACSGGRSDRYATSHSARSMDCSPAGPGSASGSGCWIDCDALGAVPVAILRSRAPWSLIADNWLRVLKARIVAWNRVYTQADPIMAMRWRGGDAAGK